MIKRLWDGFFDNMPIAAIPLSWYRQLTSDINGMTIDGGWVERTPRGLAIHPAAQSSATVKRWNVTKTDDIELTIATGDVEFGGKVKTQDFAIIEWASMTLDASVDSSGIVTIPEGETSWAVWLEIDLRHPNEVVTVRSDAEIEQLSDDSTNARWIGHMIQKRIASAVISDNVITSLVGDYQCGNVFIPRSS